jgi:transposase
MLIFNVNTSIGGDVLMDEYSLFTVALGLEKPWGVVDIKFSKDEGRLDLKLDFHKGATFPCPSCEEDRCTVHDTKERTWRHLNFFQYETYLHARVPRVRCGSCGIKQVEVPWARAGSGFTLLFEMLVLQLSREMSVAGVGALVGEHMNRIWRILEHYVERARRRVDLSSFHVLGIDEFSVRKGHEYMTSFSDIDASRVIFTGESRRKEVIKEFADDMKQRGYDLRGIDLVCCDMWDPYLNGISKHIPRATVVFDRFHIMKQMNKAIEKVRWAEQKTNEDLKKTRFIWLKNPKNLTEKQADQLTQLKKLDLKTARAYQIKLALSRFWEIKEPNESEPYLKKWYFWATHSRLDPVIEVARGIKRYWQGVLNYTLSRITNGVVEGLNSKIKTAMKRAYGFKQTQYLRTIVYLVVGKLCFD